jgi:CysZ protein
MQLSGQAALRRGFGLIMQPGLRRFVLLPLTINVAVFALSLYLLVGWFGAWLEGWLATLPAWLVWLESLFWVVFSLLALLLIFFGFSLLANLFAAPFNGLLAEAVEARLRGQPAPHTGIRQLLLELPGVILDEGRKLLYFAGYALLIWLLSWVPLLNLLAPFAWFAFAAWMMALQYADYPMGNHQIRFPRQRRILRRCPTASLGFGASTALVTMIPLLNFVVIPAAVAGATVLWYEQLEKIADKTP